jgi:hypothetical protein
MVWRTRRNVLEDIFLSLRKGKKAEIMIKIPFSLTQILRNKNIFAEREK